MLKAKIKQIGLLLGDLALLYLALYLAILIRYLQIPDTDFFYMSVEPFSWLFIIWIIIFYISGLYSLKNLSRYDKFLELFLKGWGAGLIVSIIFFYLWTFKNLSPKTTLLIFAVVYALLFLGWRYLIRYLFRVGFPKNNLGFIGYNNQVKEVIAELRHNPQLGYAPKFIVVTEDNSLSQELLAENISGVKVFKDEDNLEELASRFNINNFILVQNLSESPQWRRRLFNCLPLGINYIGFSNFYERITGRIPLELISESWFLENLDLADKKIFEFAKRCIDISLSLIAGLISLPFCLIIALAIKIQGPGPIFFRSMRLGKNNIPFKIYKFRTMTVSNNDQSMTIKNDPRITRVGGFLRKTRLDEIPQLLNILKNDMSLVGPRPERPEFVAELTELVPFFDIRTLVKPGLSGWDQISGEYHSPMPEDTHKKLQHDLFYIKNRSVFLDTTIFLKTIKTVLNYQGR